MRGELLELEATIDADELHATLETLLSSHFARATRVAAMERRMSQYCSSFMLEELDVTLDDGTELALLLKDLSPGSLFGGAVKVKPSFIYDPEREIRTYERILARHLAAARRSDHRLCPARIPKRPRWLALVVAAEPGG